MLERLLPPRPKEEPLQTPIDLTGTLTEQGHKILSLITDGQITVTEGAALLQGLMMQVKLIVVDDLDARIKKMEDSHECPK